MSNRYLLVKQSLGLNGKIFVNGAKNATLPIMASLILVEGESILENVPNSADINQMSELLRNLGAKVFFDVQKNTLKIDTSTISNFNVNPEIMNKMRASILVMGPLLARFGKARVASPGGCLIGSRPIDFHLKGLKKLGVLIEEDDHFLNVSYSKKSKLDEKIILEYPSVGATENIAMFASLKEGQTTIINAALEPEVLNFIDGLKKMGAQIEIEAPATLKIYGVEKLNPINHEIIPDRLEAGALLLAAAITGGSIHLPNARADHMDTFLEKLREMGHEVTTDNGVYFKAAEFPRSVSFKTSPYPGFPTDLQAPMMVAQCLANGSCIVDETVFENRLMHVKELHKMGAQIKINGTKAVVNGVEKLYGSRVIATDIRASCALVLAGLVAGGQTKVMNLSHWERGYEKLENKLQELGARISIEEEEI